MGVTSVRARLFVCLRPARCLSFGWRVAVPSLSRTTTRSSTAMQCSPVGWALDYCTTTYLFLTMDDRARSLREQKNKFDHAVAPQKAKRVTSSTTHVCFLVSLNSFFFPSRDVMPLVLRKFEIFQRSNPCALNFSFSLN
jgi:hypothetical protein